MQCEQLWPLILSAEHFADIFQPFCHLPTQPSATSPKIKAVLILSQLTPIFPAESNLVTKICSPGWWWRPICIWIKTERCLTSITLTLTELWCWALSTQLTAACVATVYHSRRKRWNDTDTLCFYLMRPSGKQPIDNLCEEDSFRKR